MRSILRIVSLGCALLFAALPGYAQTGSAKSPTVLNLEVNTLFPDNVTGLITPFDQRQTLLDLIASFGNTITPNTWLGLQTFTGTIAATGGTVVPTVVSPSANGVWISGANTPGISSSPIVEPTPNTYSSLLVQFKTGQNFSIPETAFQINGIFTTGYTSDAGAIASNYKTAAFINTLVCGPGGSGSCSGASGSGHAWNIASDMIIDASYGTGSSNTNNSGYNVELDMTNNASWDASVGSPVGQLINLVLGGNIGNNPILAEIFVNPGIGAAGPTYAAHIGALFQNQWSIKDATIWDLTSSSTSYLVAGTHLNGIDLSTGTFTTNQIKGTGFTFNPSGFLNTAIVNLGFSGSTAGQLLFSNATSGFITLQPPAGALGTPVITVPAITDTLAGLALANGGTNANLTASNGGVVYSTASAMAILAGTGTAGRCLLSGSNAAPTWGACGSGTGLTVGTTVIASGTTNQLLYDNGGVLGEITKGNNCVYGTNGTGVPSCVTTLPSAVTASSLTSVGSLTGGSTAAGFTVALAASTITGQLALSNGGTNANLTASNGGVVYSTASAFAVLAGTVTAGQCLLSGSSTAPTWGSCGSGSGLTVGTTTVGSGTTNQLLYDNGGVLGEVTKGNNCVYGTNGTGVPSCGTTLPSAVVASSLTSVGTLTGGATGAGFTVALATSTFTGQLGVANGGTGAATFTANGVLYGNTTSAVQVTAQGGANTILTANAGAPSWSAAPVVGTSVTTPIHYGGSSAASTLTLASTSNVSPSGDSAILEASAIIFQTIAGVKKLDFNSTIGGAWTFSVPVLMGGNTLYGGTAANSSFAINTTNNGTPSGDTFFFRGSILLFQTTGASTYGDFNSSNANAWTFTNNVYLTGLTTSTSAQTSYLCRSSGNQVISVAVANTCATSSARFKEDIEDLQIGLDQLLQLRPVAYHYKRTGNADFDNAIGQREWQMGFLAEEAAAVSDRFVVMDEKGEPRTVRYDQMAAVVVNALRQLKADNDNLKTELESLKTGTR